jgi:serine/threonine-protein kinase
MIVIAGPPGGGKSTAFPVKTFGVEYFNADDRAAELNGGSYIGIPTDIREKIVNPEFERFVLGCIDRRASFAIETTLRTEVTFQQARLAKASGFTLEMRYLALRDFPMHLERVKARADAGGHSAPESRLRETYWKSLGNLAQAVPEMDSLRVYDNTFLSGPRLVMEAKDGEIGFFADDAPYWLRRAVKLTRHVLAIEIADDGEIEPLEDIVRNTREFQKALRADKVIPLAEDDGMSLVFLEDVAAAALCAIEILAALESEPGIRVRMGVHTGPVIRRRDLRNQVNFHGEGIQIARRAMERCKVGEIIATDEVKEILAPAALWAESFDSLGEALTAGRGAGLELYRLLPQRLAAEIETAPEIEDDWVSIAAGTPSTFQIGRYPVTVRKYALFVKELGEPSKWEEQKQFLDRPVVGVTQKQAAAYCARVNGHLPSAEEWERAARGVEGRKYPWGNNSPDASRANYLGGPAHPTRVGIYQAGRTPEPEGVHDLAGNVWEWMGETGVVRGGSWASLSWELECQYSVQIDPNLPDDAVGFRCARGGA